MYWKALKQLNQLFMEGETSTEVLHIPIVKRWYEMGFLEPLNKKLVTKTEHYDSFYKKELLQQFYSIDSLLNAYDLTETNFKEEELLALLKIQNDKEEILITGKSQKEISTLYFDDAKYLKKVTRLHEAVLRILQLDILAIDEHDQQFLWVLHCNNKIPKAIILCENDNQIRKPRLNYIELWFAGGRNTAKLKFVDEPSIPFYYLCDWDNKGIEIYQDIKKNIFPNIQILIPQEPLKLEGIRSKWKTKIDYSLLPKEAKQLLERLIPEKWIEEESISHKLLRR